MLIHNFKMSKLDDIDKNLCLLNEFLAQKDSKLSKSFLNESNRLLDKINNPKSRRGLKISKQRLWDILGVALLLVAAILLYWETIRFYWFYFLRFLIILVNFFQVFFKRSG